MTKIVKSLHKTNSSPKVLETKALKYLSVSLKLPIKLALWIQETILVQDFL